MPIPAVSLGQMQLLTKAFKTVRFEKIRTIGIKSVLLARTLVLDWLYRFSNDVVTVARS